MQKIQQMIQSDSLFSKKELMQMKRLKAKQKTNVSTIKIISKQDLRKQKNRSAAQRSRDKKKEYLEHLQHQYSRLKDIIDRCQVCSALELANRREQRMQEQHEHSEHQQLIIQSPPTLANNETFIREEANEESSHSNLSQYFWFACLVVIVCMINYQHTTPANRQLVGDIRMYVPQLKVNLTSSPKRVQLEGSKALVKNQPNYCQLCIQCLKNVSSYSNRSISLFGNETAPANSSNATNKILYCKSRAKFFQKIYESLREKQQQNGSRQITRVLIKGNIIKDLMQQNCFIGEQINSEEQYLISFSLAILQMSPVKATRKSRLSVHGEQ